ncbi:hypothetical protein EDF38_1279 [Frigoribacterium sp. PhB160]|uniref:molecular chaperone DnaJ n=1 Tax=Frigoribacterium sp. PhB160 TaxID=2485192 RepID=UPI000F4755EA|nr:molecular chaperone DnaJ [Frigoribacterium sp. PhB160]ROS62176.1 hypothetical protein EDF38_1279 [Frigoribacterium sp. PhB160]
MAEWPSNMKTGPIREWPGALTPSAARKFAPFKTNEIDSYRRRSTPLSSTLELLDRELRMIDGRDVELLVAIAPEQFRLDGQPRAQAKAEHPGVILSLRSRHGQLSYPCDTFTTWQDNLRAIALALEALRKVDRYGVTSHGEQYRGFLAIESAREAGPAMSTAAQAQAWIEALVAPHSDVPMAEHTLTWTVRRAKSLTHPDRGGSAADFNLVTRAELILRQAGAL